MKVTLIYDKFSVNLINIYKVTSYKTVFWPTLYIIRYTYNEANEWCH